jgi:hypothetical protein
MNPSNRSYCRNRFLLKRARILLALVCCTWLAVLYSPRAEARDDGDAVQLGFHNLLIGLGDSLTH